MGLVDAVLRAVEPSAALRRTWVLPGDGPAWIVGIGKASIGLAREAAGILGERLRGGVVCAPEAVNLPGLEVCVCDHPLPTVRNLAAARRVERLAREASADSTLVVLVSGGGSAHLTLPQDGVSLEDLREMTDALLRGGAAIRDLNTCRKHLERLKGGRLAAATLARVETFILSDIPGDPLDQIASGPTVADPTTNDQAITVLRRASPGLAARLGPRMVETPKSLPSRVSPPRVIAGNADAVRSAARWLSERGQAVTIAAQDAKGEARGLGEVIGAWLRSLASPGIGGVWGGETTVSGVPRGAIGGRNLEAAASAAQAIAGIRGAYVLTLATDGKDGSSDAAGAFVTGETAAAAKGCGVDLSSALDTHECHAALDAVGALVRTGPTGTNVADLAVAGLWRGEVD